MTKVYFVRHAEPNYTNHNDELRELTEKGMKERKLVTEFLSDKSIDIVLSSPYKRSIDTIKEFADEYDYRIIKVHDFRERMVDSVWIDDFAEFSKKQWQNFQYKHFDGENLAEVQTRNISALNIVLSKYKDKNIVIGSHGTALSTIINYYDNAFGYSEFEQIKLLMPWIVCFTFEGDECISIQKYNLFIKEL